MSFLWKQRTQREKEQKKNLEEVNQLLLESILPTKVSKYYMEEENNAGYYSESCECACVIFASIPEFWSMYSETEINQKGVEWLRLLNEIIGDFDDIIEKKKYRGKVEKIKTIGSTYMAATGLGENQPQTEEEKVKMLHQNVVLMAHFAFELIRTLNRINREIFNDLKMRIGLNHGPVVAGVIGSQKPLYDIWGDTVNVASRMDSTGHLTKIQVTEATANILSSHGFVLEKRGSVPVKGKGELTTFFVVSEQRKS
ncbi:Adenylate cyclase type 2 [Geodia barretti]|uniref:adenylate cyclase n=1 Tax=Geodia barretti TaxID=519541 RepID=A0AA35TDY1_GEOBA|nr:Adenylate cyclase type 2 [Geodia barretti]